MSREKARATARYLRLRSDFMRENPFCEFPSGGSTVSCTNRTASIHHMMGQHYKVMNDTRYWMGVCIQHHAWIEEHKKEARKRGLILYK